MKNKAHEIKFKSDLELNKNYYCYELKFYSFFLGIFIKIIF